MWGGWGGAGGGYVCVAYGYMSEWEGIYLERGGGGGERCRVEVVRLEPTSILKPE